MMDSSKNDGNTPATVGFSGCKMKDKSDNMNKIFIGRVTVTEDIIYGLVKRVKKGESDNQLLKIRGSEVECLKS